MVLLKWSNANLSAANSSRYGLYLSSVGDVHLDAKPTGCILTLVSLDSSCVVNRCDKTAPNPSLQPSLVMINEVPSNLRA